MVRSPAGESESGGEEDASTLLETVLSSLYDFGEPLLGVNKKKKAQKRNAEDTGANERGRQRQHQEPEPDPVAQGRRKSPSSFFQSLKDELAHQKNSAPEPTATDAAHPKQAQPQNTTQIEVVTFHGPKRKKRLKLEIADKGAPEEQAKPSVQEKYINHQEHTLEKARLEVHQFGITGFKKKEQQVLEQERAIMLGAKAPKKEYMNYKILQEKIKRDKAMKKGENVMAIRSDSQKRRKTKGHEARKSKKKTKHSILPTGQVGTFKNGTLVLRKSDIKKIKSSKGIH